MVCDYGDSPSTGASGTHLVQPMTVFFEGKDIFTASCFNESHSLCLGSTCIEDRSCVVSRATGLD